MLLTSKLNIPLKSSHRDESFGTKIITIGQCVNKLRIIKYILVLLIDHAATLDLACCNYGLQDFQVSFPWLFTAVANMLHAWC